jgi:hypothetical protein
MANGARLVPGLMFLVLFSYSESLLEFRSVLLLSFVLVIHASGSRS